MSDETLRDPRLPQYPVIASHPTYDDVRSNFSVKDYQKYLGSAAVSFPMGYIFGIQQHKRLAVPSMVVTGLLGTFGGFLWAYQSSALRLQGYKENSREQKLYIPQNE